MKRHASVRILALAALLSVIVAACGQKPGVFGSGAGAGGGLAGPGPGAAGPGGTGPAGTGPDGTVPGETGPGAVGPGGTGPGGAGPGGAGPVAVGGGDRTGITPTTITIGIHAPTTGAAPVQGKAFEAGARLYWNWLHKTKKEKVFGRTVEIVFRNDQYRPTVAVTVCNEMATSERAFLLIGGAGTDQINACAQYADANGIPYLSPGVQEAGLTGRRTYFAVTMSYKQQMVPLAQMLAKENRSENYGRLAGDGAVKVGFVRPNTPNFNDADQALRAAIQANKWSYKSYPVSKEGRSDEAATVATTLRRDGVDIVIPITPPVFTIALVQSMSREYRPMYAGVGISNNINQAVDYFCRNSNFKGLWFSPWPGWREVMADSAGRYDANFAGAARTYAAAYNTRTGGGDILLALWGIMRSVHQMMLAAGPNMSRQSFVQTLNNFSLSTKVFPDIQYSPTNHLGARNVHVLEALCSGSNSQWVTPNRYPGRYSSF